MLNPLSKQAHTRDNVPDFYTDTARVTGQPPKFLSNFKPSTNGMRQTNYQDHFSDRKSSWIRDSRETSPILSQVKLREFYEQNGYKTKRPLTIIETPLLE